jgi:hypothetical protein
MKRLAIVSLFSTAVVGLHAETDLAGAMPGNQTCRAVMP